MMIILGGLAGLMLAPSTALATLPASLSTLAGLFAAAPFSLLMGKYGRKVGFVVGGGIAIVGALVGVWALMSGSFVLLCLGHLALGAALACYQFFRFAAAEVVSAAWQPVAISLILTSGLIAAIVGPQVFILAKDILAPVPLAGAYGALAVLSVIGLIPLALTTLPPPAPSAPQTMRQRFAALSVLKRKPIRLAVGLGALSQGIMVFLMVPTPLAMIGCGFSEALAGDVIRWHVVAMFAPSFFTGFLIQMLSNAVAAEERALVQGANDTVIALVSTLFAFGAGAIIAGFGWAVLAGVSLAILVLASLLYASELREAA